MRTALILAAALLAPALAAQPAVAQLPTASGKQIAMSNAAWKLFIPSTYHQRPGAVADLLVHFHGDSQTYWNNAKYANLNALIVTVNYNGLSSAYSTPFSNASLFQSIIDEALTKARAEPNIPDALAWDKLGVSSFSAGYGAVREILKSTTYRNEVDALLAADSLYATTAGDQTPLDSQMVDYKTFATLAKNGQKTFIYSHSLVPTYTYESTQECGDELLQHLGLAASAYNVNGLGDLDFYRRAESGNFRLYGALGSDGDSHLEHLRWIGEFLEELPLAKIPTQSADFNEDGYVNAADLTEWRGAYGPNSVGDADGDNDTDGADFLQWQRQLAAGSSAAVPVPEPASLTLLLLAAAARFACRSVGRVLAPTSPRRCE
jgi:hypothetical protein